MEPILTVRGMDKRFGATVALKAVDIDIYPGEIRGLIGENGSGKSTLTSIIAGMQRADAGEMSFHGKPWQPASMIDALERGVGMIVQETGTIPGITVAENLFLGETSQFRNRLGLVSKRAMEQEARKALDVIRAEHIQPGGGNGVHGQNLKHGAVPQILSYTGAAPGRPPEAWRYTATPACRR